MLPALQALLFLAPLIVAPGLFEPANLPQTVFVQVFAGALLTFALATGARVPAPWRIAPFGLPFSLLVGFSLLSLIWAHTFREAWPEALRWISILVVFSLAAACTASSPLAARRLLSAVFLGGVLVAVLGLLQFYFRVDWVPQSFPPAATFMNRNVAVSFVVAVWPLGLALARRDGRCAGCAVGLACALMGAFLFHAFTKSGWLAAAVQVAVALGWWAMRPRSERLRGVAGVSVAVVVLAVLAHLTPEGLRPRWREARDAVAFTLTAPLVGPDRPLAQLTPDDRANSIRSRRAIWLNTLVLVREHPIGGVGLGNHKVHYPRYARRAALDPAFGLAQIDHVHNDPLQLLAELGLVGFFLGAWMLVAVTQGFRASSRQSGSDAVLVLASALSLLGLFVDSLFNFPFQRALPPVVVAVLLGVLGGRLMALPATTAPPRVAGAVLAAAATLVVVLTQAHILYADRHVLLARLADAKRDWGATEVSAVRALGRDPARREALFLRGRALLEQGEPRTAAVVLRRLLVAYPDDVATLGNLAAAERASGHPREARTVLERLLTLWPENARAHASLARELESAGDAQGALAHHAQAAAFDPGNAAYAFGHGVAALRMRDLPTAETALRAAVRLDPGHAQAWKALGVTLLEQPGRRAEALPHLKHALELAPDMPDAARMRALLAEDPLRPTR